MPQKYRVHGGAEEETTLSKLVEQARKRHGKSITEVVPVTTRTIVTKRGEPFEVTDEEAVAMKDSPLYSDSPPSSGPTAAVPDTPTAAPVEAPAEPPRVPRRRGGEP